MYLHRQLGSGRNQRGNHIAHWALRNWRIAHLHNCTFVQLKNCILFVQGITSWASSVPSCRCHVSLTGRTLAADHTVEMWTFRNCWRVQGYYYCQWQLLNCALCNDVVCGGRRSCARILWIGGACQGQPILWLLGLALMPILSALIVRSSCEQVNKSPGRWHNVKSDDDDGDGNDDEDRCQCLSPSS